MKYILYLLLIVLFLFTGCAEQKSQVYVKFLTPSNKIQNLDDVKNIKITVNKINLKGISNKSKQDIANLIKGKLSALVYKEQFLDVSDDLLQENIKSL